MYRFIYDIVIYVFELLIAFAFFTRGYEKKLKSNLLIIATGSLLFVGSSLIFDLFYNVILNLILFFAINFVFAIFCFKIPLKDAVIHSILLVTIMFSAEILTVFIASSIFKIPTDTFRNNLVIYIILSSISKLIYLAFSQLLLLFIKKEKYYKRSIKQFIPLFIFPILTIASSVIFVLISFEYKVSVNYQIAVSVICTLYIFICIFIFIYYQILADNEAKLDELEAERNFYNLNDTYLNVLEHQNKELQMLFHDIKHHYLALNSFENIEEVKEYIKKIYPEFEGKNTIKISNNKMLDLIISKYIVACKNNGIKFDYEVKTTNLDYIDDAELSIILNNILDNAVEAAVKSQERQIEFSLRHINNMDLLSVVNSCDTPPKHINRRLITTKFNTDSHGFGTRIIQKHAKKNNGKYEWFYDENEHRFHLTILFQRKNIESGTV